ncbi:hypothetical protein KAFR_0G03400 [Kazachstania africana CBS 2517]|uniref:Uncharacterized protein n=1 Tax=Kazachstania africana (strain ATCC 22294 / BCRC 22015 / CBS 2517 / CECT 1963 / NBRC 1671 / NRRL Y-8276) TaxID=1071382 RepID=H2AYC2_KAZAF|nr:hypothetical protein KAFR_0G03400 [Kazachstania africana CBS 2517]CCF59372.1 hypothetical protein KAFR_0G03400 [Kazachstania africana CBS 2517]
MLSHNSRPFNVLLILISIVLLFATFILTIVGTAGSTSNYNPINRIYLGDADISHINVTKVLPQFDSTLKILGTNMLNQSNTVESIFHSISGIASNESSLAALLQILSTTENTDATVDSMLDLSKLLLDDSSSQMATAMLAQINQLFDASSNDTMTLLSLETLIGLELQNNSNSNVTAMTLNLLNGSSNPLDSVKNLETLNDLSTDDKENLVPVFELFQNTNNATGLMASLATVMSNGESISGSRATLLLTALQSQLASGANVSSVISSLSGLITSDERPVVNAIADILEYSTDTNTTLSILEELVSNNVTSSEYARTALTSLASIVADSSNTTNALMTVSELSNASISNSTLTTMQLASLTSLLESSNDEGTTISVLSNLQNAMTSSSTIVESVPSLFTLLSSSSDPMGTYRALVVIVGWAHDNPSEFQSTLTLLENYKNAPNKVTSEQLIEMSPDLLEFLNVATSYRIAIFNLCKANANNEILSCSKPHAVQNLDIRAIIYESLEDSDFKPFMDALDIQADDLHLEGKLLHREHEYVSAVRAILALNLLTIIFSFFLIVVLIILLFKFRIIGIISVVMAFCVALFSILSGIITAVIAEVIKSGTYEDNYGVVYKSGQNYMGLIWSGFAFAFISFFLIVWYVVRYRKMLKAEREEQEKGNYYNDVVDDVSSTELDANAAMDTSDTISSVERQKNSAAITTTNGNSNEKMNSESNYVISDSSGEDQVPNGNIV